MPNCDRFKFVPLQALRLLWGSVDYLGLRHFKPHDFNTYGPMTYHDAENATLAKQDLGKRD